MTPSRRLVALTACAAIAGAGMLTAVLLAPQQSRADAQTASPTPGPTHQEFVPGLANDGTSPGATISVQQGTATAVLSVSIASTPAQRESGLMWITYLPPDGGMLFLFPGPGTVGFWMANTYIPLDIAYISAQGTLLAVREGVPLDRTVLLPPGRYLYVIETNQGWWASHGFAAGAHVQLPPGLPPAS